MSLLWKVAGSKEQGRLSAEGREYLVKQFISHVNITVLPALITVGLLVFFESNKPNLSYMIAWTVLMVFLQLSRYYLAEHAIKNWKTARSSRLFFCVDFFAVFWWVAYLYIMGFNEETETHYLWRHFIVYIVFVYYLNIMQYVWLTVVSYSSIVCLGILIYLIWWTNLEPNSQISLIVLDIVGWGAMLLFGYSSHQSARNTYRIIAENKALIAQLDEMATHDELTRVHNRRYFQSQLSQHFSLYYRNQEAFSLALIDVDYFKRFNDEYGHDMGDKILISLSQYIQSHIRATDIFARYGGEEFVLILPQSSIETAIDELESLRQNINEHQFVLEGIVFNITVSVGVTTVNESDDEASFLKRADSAMYDAKRYGRNQIVTG